MIIKAILEYNRNLEGQSHSKLLRLMQKVTYLESQIMPGTDSYCTHVQGYVTAIEILALIHATLENSSICLSGDLTQIDLSSVLAVSSSSISGLRALLVTLERIGDIITVEVVVINYGNETKEVEPIQFFSFLYDEKERSGYQFTSVDSCSNANIPIGGFVKYTAKAALPSDANPTHLTIPLDSGITFSNVAVQQQSSSSISLPRSMLIPTPDIAE